MHLFLLLGHLADALPIEPYSSECLHCRTGLRGNRIHNPGVASAMLYQLSHMEGYNSLSTSADIGNIILQTKSHS